MKFRRKVLPPSPCSVMLAIFEIFVAILALGDPDFYAQCLLETFSFWSLWHSFLVLVQVFERAALGGGQVALGGGGYLLLFSFPYPTLSSSSWWMNDRGHFLFCRWLFSNEFFLSSTFFLRSCLKDLPWSSTLALPRALSCAQTFLTSWQHHSKQCLCFKLEASLFPNSPLLVSVFSSSCFLTTHGVCLGALFCFPGQGLRCLFFITGVQQLLWK